MTTTIHDLESRALAIPEQVQGLAILDSESCQQGERLFLVIKDLRKEIDTTFTPMTKAAHASWQETLHQRRRHEAPLKLAETMLEARMSTYRAVEERKRQEAQRKAQEAAQLQEALDAETRGDHAGAESALNGQGVVSVHVPSAVPTGHGVSSREHWHCEVTDFTALVKAVGEGKAPLAYLLPNQSALNQAARSLKQELSVIPGVRAIKTTTLADGRR